MHPPSLYIVANHSPKTVFLFEQHSNGDGYVNDRKLPLKKLICANNRVAYDL